MSLVFVLGPLPDLSIPLWNQPTAASPFILQMWPWRPTLTKEQVIYFWLTSETRDSLFVTLHDEHMCKTIQGQVSQQRLLFYWWCPKQRHTFFLLFFTHGITRAHSLCLYHRRYVCVCAFTTPTPHPTPSSHSITSPSVPPLCLAPESWHTGWC